MLTSAPQPLALTTPTLSRLEPLQATQTQSRTIRTFRSRRPATAPLSNSQTQSSNFFSNKADDSVSVYISHLQGQIHLLEMEVKVLKEKVGTQPSQGGAFSSGADNTDLEIDPTIRDLRLLYMKTEQDWKEEQQVYFLSSLLSSLLLSIFHLFSNFNEKLII